MLTNGTEINFLGRNKPRWTNSEKALIGTTCTLYRRDTMKRAIEATLERAKIVGLYMDSMGVKYLNIAPIERDQDGVRHVLLFRLSDRMRPPTNDRRRTYFSLRGEQLP